MKNNIIKLFFSPHDIRSLIQMFNYSHANEKNYGELQLNK